MFCKIADWIDTFSEWTGKIICWLTLIMALVMFFTVILRYIFNMGWIWIRESVTYMHGAVFMLSAGFALLHDEHVRIDILYRPMSQRKKGLVNIFGILFLLFPTCFVVFYYAFPYVANSWAVLEDSKETGGLPGVFILKTVILIFPILLSLQGISKLIRAIRDVFIPEPVQPSIH